MPTFADWTPEQRAAARAKADETRRRNKAAKAENPSGMSIGAPPKAGKPPREPGAPPSAARPREFHSDAAKLIHDVSVLAARPPLGEHWVISPLECNLTVTGAQMAFPDGADGLAGKLGWLAPLLPFLRVLVPLGIGGLVFGTRAMVTWQQWQQQKAVQAGLANGTLIVVPGPDGRPMAVPRQQYQQQAPAYQQQAPPPPVEGFAPDPTSPREDKAPMNWDAELFAARERVAHAAVNGAG